jgi:hypothetical protein
MLRRELSRAARENRSFGGVYPERSRRAQDWLSGGLLEHNRLRRPLGRKLSANGSFSMVCHDTPPLYA